MYSIEDTRAQVGMPKKAWTAKEVEINRKEISEVLTAIFHEGGARAKQDYCLEQIKKLTDLTESLEQMRCYLYIVFVLHHSQYYLGLTPTVVGQLLQHGFAILKVSGIGASRSKLSYLYGDLHLVSSQIQRKIGKNWLALWDFRNASRYYSNNPYRDDAFQCLAMALRTRRMGQFARAEKFYGQAFANTEDPMIKATCLLGIAKIKRLSDDCETAEEILGAIESLTKDHEIMTEVKWELACIETRRRGSLSPLARLMRAKRPHYRAHYLLESHLWARCTANLEFSKSLTTVDSLRRSPNLGLKNLRHLLLGCRAIEDAYDTAYKFEQRMDFIGRVLEEKASFSCIGQELLFLAAAARWLSRNRDTVLAAIILEEYVALCRKLSSGKSNDVLGIMGDLLDKESKQQDCSQEFQATA
jgi:hypothetical protein